ncbi:DUF4855 domain-containing protein [Parabacteroides bouchesdurhonensis]|uniref:DUF4855 domain-containing protein n=1 Tax=Parabacteroides bouchesdurhonensis TaxID=1936995 RepID=UPI00164D86C4|nr:DUF4855 domain-containing protein [Parabacteroides bouchesdurhonensis]
MKRIVNLLNLRSSKFFVYVLMLTFVLPQLASAIKPFARDMVLIYSGGQHRSYVWNKDKLTPYVSMEDEKGNFHWLFDGFLFLEIHNGNGRGFASYYQKQAARKLEWKKLLDDYFTPGLNICALNDAIEAARKENPKNFTKRKIVLGMPEPIPDVDYWGGIDGKSLDFSKQADRLAACQWFVDYATKKFEEAKLDNLELSGFYWIAEEATNSRDLARNVGDYVRLKGYNFNWIPYFKSDGFQEWRNLGFDIAYLQPNYFFNQDVPYERMDETSKLAFENGMCVEMEFDERAMKSKGFGYRLSDYIKAFDQYGIFENLPIAYYQGGTAFYNLCNSPEKEDNDLYMELARRIANRQEKKELKGMEHIKEMMRK